MVRERFPTQVSGKGSDKKKMYKLYGLQILKVHITMVKKKVRMKIFQLWDFEILQI